ncbi:hypothetical protein P0D96_46735 [Paraburkholderia sp. RL17-347-BIC-D]
MVEHLKSIVAPEQAIIGCKRGRTERASLDRVIGVLLDPILVS